MDVVYDESGFASILGQLIQQKIEDPAKRKMAKKMKGKIVVELRDMNVSATVIFSGNKIEVRNGELPANSLISADFETINTLSSGKVGMLGVLKLMITGKLKIKGIGMARKFQKLLS